MIVHTKYHYGKGVEDFLEFEIDTQTIHPMIEKNKDNLYQIIFAPPLQHPTFEMESSVFLEDGGRWFWGPYYSPEDYYATGLGYSRDMAAQTFVESEVMSGGDFISYAIVPVTLKQLIMITEEGYKHAEALGKCKIIKR